MFSSQASSSNIRGNRDDSSDNNNAASASSTSANNNTTSDSASRIRALAGRDDLISSLNNNTTRRIAELETEREELLDELDQFTEQFFRPLNQARDSAWLDRYHQLLSSDEEGIGYGGNNINEEIFHNEFANIFDRNQINAHEIVENEVINDPTYSSGLDSGYSSSDDQFPTIDFEGSAFTFAFVDRASLLQTLTGRGGIDTDIFGFNTSIDPDESLIADLFRLVINFIIICFAILALIFFEIDFFPSADLYANLAKNASYEFCLPTWANVAIGMFDLDRACISRLPYETF